MSETTNNVPNSVKTVSPNIVTEYQAWAGEGHMWPAVPGLATGAPIDPTAGISAMRVTPVRPS
jgi:hypothetical protein